MGRRVVPVVSQVKAPGNIFSSGFLLLIFTFFSDHRSNSLVLLHSKLKVGSPGKPMVHCSPWHSGSGQELVAMAFHPLGIRVAAAST
jgi:hypothetical protein